MANWLLLVKAVVLVSLPSLLLLFALSINSHQDGQGDQSATVTGHIHSHPSTPQPVPVPPAPQDAQRTVLVTGSAGFIGYHVSCALVEQWGATVVGLDNFNDYYNVQLKKDRTNELIRIGVHPYRGDVCDSTLLSHLFSKYQFTDVVHLAAQAGVRHSLEQPVNYIQANVQCFLTLLDTLSHQKVTATVPPKLVFASSSSVYGEGATIPFSTSSPPHPTTNVYAASKLANEQFAEAYCSQHGLRTIGLRFFTVYGPWGRPDMAVYKFAKRINEGLPIPMFDSPQPLKRDFTFVNDTVGGVLAALKYTPTLCGEVYNVGTGRPSTLDTMLKHLEEELKIPAKIDLLPLPPSDLQTTYADISETRRVLGFNPTVSLKEGIHEFVSWFKWYSNRRRTISTDEMNAQLEEALKVGEREVAAVRVSRLKQTNTAYRERMKALRNRYEEFTEERGRDIHSMKKSGFVFHAGVDSPGGTVIKAPGYRGDVKRLREQCLQTEQCIAFNTMAELKNKLQPQHMWTRTAEGEGLYVADINMCESDLHDCDRYADCIHEGPASYSCSCQPGYIRLGRQCVEKHTESNINDIEWAWQLSDHLEGLSWDKLVQGRPFTFIQGLDSPGGDYMVVEGGAGNPKRLKEVCSHTHHCVGFNTNGILKYSLLPPQKWARWTDHPQHGLYVRDINYCALDLEECPTHSHCSRHAPANYSCVCEAPYSMKIDKDNFAKCIRQKPDNSQTDLIHIIISVDHEHFPGLLGVVNSALSHASQPERLKFHVVLSGVEESVLLSYLGCYGYKDHPQLEVTKLNTNWLEGRIRVYTDVGRVGNLASLANFGRFLFHEHFPKLNQAIYLDADTAVLGDIGEFWERLLTTDQLLLAVPRKSPSYGNIFRGNVKDKFHKRYGFIFEDSDPTFNAGVYGINFDLWRSRNMHTEVQYWLEEQARQPLWEFGTQPIMLLVAYRQWEELEREWNIDSLGWKRVVGEDVLNSAKLLHWNGKGKPWLEEGLHRDLWRSHLPLECSGHGSCTTSISDPTDKGYWYQCLCKKGYVGTNCQIKLKRPDIL